MLPCNNVSRFNVAIAAVCGGATNKFKVQARAYQLIAGLKHEDQKATEYARANRIGTVCISLVIRSNGILRGCFSRSSGNVCHSVFH